MKSLSVKLFYGRWTRQKCYDADDYNSMIDTNNEKKAF